MRRHAITKRPSIKQSQSSSEASNNQINGSGAETAEAANISISCQMSFRLKPETFINREHHFSAFRSFAGCSYLLLLLFFHSFVKRFARFVTNGDALFWRLTFTVQLNSDYVEMYELREETARKWTRCRTLQIYFQISTRRFSSSGANPKAFRMKRKQKKQTESDACVSRLAEINTDTNQPGTRRHRQV